MAGREGSRPDALRGGGAQSEVSHPVVGTRKLVKHEGDGNEYS